MLPKVLLGNRRPPYSSMEPVFALPSAMRRLDDRVSRVEGRFARMKIYRSTIGISGRPATRASAHGALAQFRRRLIHVAPGSPSTPLLGCMTILLRACHRRRPEGAQMPLLPPSIVADPDGLMQTQRHDADLRYRPTSRRSICRSGNEGVGILRDPVMVTYAAACSSPRRKPELNFAAGIQRDRARRVYSRLRNLPARKRRNARRIATWSR